MSEAIAVSNSVKTLVPISGTSRVVAQGDLMGDMALELVMGTMAAKLGAMGPDAFQTAPVELAPGIRVKMECTSGDFLDRLFELSRMCRKVAAAASLDLSAVRRRLLDVDGWILVDGTLMTPIWMETHLELPASAFNRHPELGWLFPLSWSPIA